MIELEFDIAHKHAGFIRLLANPKKIERAVNLAKKEALSWLGRRLRQAEPFAQVLRPTVRFVSKKGRLWIGLNPIDTKHIKAAALKSYPLKQGEFILNTTSKGGRRFRGVYTQNPSNNHRQGLIKIKKDVEDDGLLAIYQYLNGMEDEFHKRLEKHLTLAIQRTHSGV
jgi:hypothetical protein